MTWDIAPPKRWIYETVSYDEGWLAKVTFIGAYVDQVFDELLGLADGLAVSRFTFIAANDYRTRYKINEGIDKYFHDDDYSPKPEDDDYAVILARREVVCDFLFRRAHLKKEVLRTLGCACSFLIAGAAYLYKQPRLEIGAYLVLIATFIINEAFTVHWRLIRDRRLREVDEKAGKSRMLA